MNISFLKHEIYFLINRLLLFSSNVYSKKYGSDESFTLKAFHVLAIHRIGDIINIKENKTKPVLFNSKPTDIPENLLTLSDIYL